MLKKLLITISIFCIAQSCSTSKINEDGTYTDDVIVSKKNCDKWLENNRETIYSLNRESLDKFWEENPNGVIHFG